MPVSRDCPVYGIVGSMTIVLAVVLVRRVVEKLELSVVSPLVEAVGVLPVPLLTMMYAVIEPLAPVE